jgi:succinoglycan biosynthesis protein ExoU
MTVTMIIAAYNAQATIERAVASALAEPDIMQVIVVDDASTDDTANVAKRLDDGSGRVVVLCQSLNAGPSAARNKALAAATADWVGILDADDFLLPGRTAGLLKFVDHADMVADDMLQLSEHDIDGLPQLLLGGTLMTPRSIGFEEFVLSNITRTNRYRRELGFIKPLMRRDFLMKHNLRYQEHMRLGEDFELYARALALGARLIIAPAQGYVSVIRANSLSGRHSAHDLLQLRDSVGVLANDMSLNDRAKSALSRNYRSVNCRLQWRLLIEAVKQRDAGSAMRTFLHPFPVPIYLIGQLLNQAYCRSIGRFFQETRPC